MTAASDNGLARASSQAGDMLSDKAEHELGDAEERRTLDIAGV